MIEFVLFVIEAGASFFLRDDEEWNVRRIVTVSVVAIALIVFGSWMYC
jgi:hypothetical protein